MNAAAREAGRDPAQLGMEGRVSWHGDAPKLAGEAAAWRDAGATHLAVNTMGAGLASLSDHVGKLEADHAHVSDLLDGVEAASNQLGQAGEQAVREGLVSALRTLSDDLLAHLQYEEEHISGTLRAWTRWPGW